MINPSKKMRFPFCFIAISFVAGVMSDLCGILSPGRKMSLKYGDVIFFALNSCSFVHVTDVVNWTKSSLKPIWVKNSEATCWIKALPR